MKNEKLINAIGMIDDRYIEEAHQPNRKKFRWNWDLAGKIAIGFACLCLLVTIGPKILFNGAKSDAAGSGYYMNGGGEEYDTNSYAPSTYESSYRADSDASYYENSKDNTSVNETAIKSKMLIVTGELNMETMDLDKLLEELEKNVSAFGGYFQDSSISTSGSYRYYTAVVRVPAENFTEFLDGVEKAGNVTYYHENTKDITDTYTDLSARVTPLKAEEARVLDFYKEAKDLDDLLMIESRLTEIRYEIDYLETQLKNYDLQVAYSTLTISIRETSTYTETSVSFWDRLASSFRYGWTNFVSGIEDFVLDVVYYFWNILLFAAIIFGAYKLYKYIRSRRNR